MSIEALIIWLVIGALAGWLAGQIMTGGGFGLVGNVVVGIVGAFVAGWLFPSFWPSMGSPMVNAIVHALVGAIIVLFVVGLVRRTPPA